MAFYKKKLIYFNVIQHLSDSAYDPISSSSLLRKNCDQYSLFVFFKVRLYVFRAYLNSSRSPPRFPHVLEILSKVFLASFTSLFHYLFKYAVIRTIFIFLFSISISRSFSQIIFSSKSSFEHSKGKYDFFSLINFHSSATALSLSLSSIRS